MRSRTSGSIAGQDAVDRLQADDLAHDALGDGLHGFLGVENVEDIILGIGGIDLPDHAEPNVDDVLVAGEHLALGEIVEVVAAIADLGDLLIPDRNLDHRADRPRPIGIEAGGRLAGVAAEDQVDADLIGLHGIKGAQGEPDEQRQKKEDNDAAQAQTAAAARNDAAQTLLDAAQQVLKVAWRRSDGALAPRTLA